MSLRSSSFQAGFSFSNTMVGTMPTGATTGDYLIIVTAWSNGGGSSATVTPTDVTCTKIVTSCIGNNATIDFWIVPYNVALTLAFASSTNDWCTNHIFCYSGRNGTFTFATKSAFTGGSQMPPAAISLTGGTANAGDDLIALIGVDPNNSDNWTYSGGTCTAGTFTDVAGSTNSQGAQVGSQYLDNFAAGGATGSVSITATGTPAFISADFAGLVLAFQQSGGGGPIGPAIAEWNYQKTSRAVCDVAIVRSETLPILATTKAWVADWGYRTQAAKPASLVIVDRQMPIPMVLRKPPRLDRDYQTRHVGPGRVTHDVQLPIPMVLRKAPRLDRDYQTRHVNPSRATADAAVLASPFAAISTWHGDTNSQRSQPAPNRVSQDTQLPGTSTVASVSVLADWQYVSVSSAKPQQPQDQPLPQIGVDWFGDWVSARQLPAPKVAVNSDSAPAISVLSGWAADGNVPRQLPQPNRVAHDSQLPFISILSTWCADGNVSRPLTPPYRAVHDTQLPFVSVLSTWAADGNISQKLPPPSRAVHDVQIPRPSIILTLAPEGNYQRNISPPYRVSHDGQFPAVRVMSTWAADGNATKLSAIPGHVTHDVQLPNVIIPVLFTWAADGNQTRTLPGPKRVTHDAQHPRANALFTWAADGNATFAPRNPLKSTYDTQLPTVSVIQGWAGDGNRQVTIPIATRATHDNQPPAVKVLLTWSPESQLTKLSATPYRAAQDSLVSVANAAPKVSPDWNYQTRILSSVRAIHDGALPSFPVGFTSDCNFQKSSYPNYRVAQDNVVPGSTVLDFSGDQFFYRSLANPLTVQLPAGGELVAARPLTKWAADWSFQTAQFTVRNVLPFDISFELFSVLTDPGCAYGSVAALYSAIGSMFVTASATGDISPTGHVGISFIGCSS